MTTIIKECENTSTGMKFVFTAVQAQKKFAVRRLHKEKLEDSMSCAFGVTETYIDDEEIILDDFFEADKLFDNWLSIY